MPGEDDRREAFVDWLTQADNPFFAKVEVNRIWGHLMGRGIVEPVDDFRDSNPPSNAALLDALAADFVAKGFDRKHTLRTILNSRTYQLSRRKNEFNKTDTKYFSHAKTRLLSAEQLLDAICHVTGVRGEVRRPARRHAGHAAAQPRREQLLPEGLRPAAARNGLPVRALDRVEPVAGPADDQRPAGPRQAARRQQPLPPAGDGRQDRRGDHQRAVPGGPLPPARPDASWTPRPSTSPPRPTACKGWKMSAGRC